MLTRLLLCVCVCLDRWFGLDDIAVSVREGVLHAQLVVTRTQPQSLAKAAFVTKYGALSFCPAEGGSSDMESQDKVRRFLSRLCVSLCVSLALPLSVSLPLSLFLSLPLATSLSLSVLLSCFASSFGACQANGL